METEGLLVGVGRVNCWMLRVLCESPWEGGGGYQPADVARWTPDQVWFRLCSKDFLKLGGRTRSVSPQAVERNDDGTVAGRAADGTPIRGRITGKSLARQLMERARTEKVVEEARKARRKKRR